MTLKIANSDDLLKEVINPMGSPKDIVSSFVERIEMVLNVITPCPGRWTYTTYKSITTAGPG